MEKRFLTDAERLICRCRWDQYSITNYAKEIEKIRSLLCLCINFTVLREIGKILCATRREEKRKSTRKSFSFLSSQFPRKRGFVWSEKLKEIAHSWIGWMFLVGMGASWRFESNLYKSRRKFSLIRKMFSSYYFLSSKRKGKLFEVSLSDNCITIHQPAYPHPRYADKLKMT